jgi:hypothetical protein
MQLLLQLSRRLQLASSARTIAASSPLGGRVAGIRVERRFIYETLRTGNTSGLGKAGASSGILSGDGYLCHIPAVPNDVHALFDYILNEISHRIYGYVVMQGTLVSRKTLGMSWRS